MTSVIPIPVSFLIGTKDANLLTGPDGKTYLNVMHNWSVCVISVESTNVTKTLVTVFVIMLTSSSQILCENTIYFYAFYFHIFLYEMPRMDHTSSEAKLYKENFHNEMNQ